MRRKATQTKSAAQRKPRKQSPGKSADLRAEIKSIRENAAKLIREAEKRLESSRATRAKEAKAAKAREAKSLERAERRLKTAGIFEPKRFKSKSAQTSALKKLSKQFADFLNPKTTFFIPTKSKRKASKAKKRAAELGMKTTPKGFFFPREGAKKAALKFNKERGEYGVVTERKEKSKRTGRTRTVRRAYPIEPLSSASDKLEALRSTGHRLLGAKPRDHDRLAFIVEGPHRGRSKMTYATPELLVRDLEKRYDRSQHAPAHLAGKMRSQFLGFLDIVSVQKTTVSQWGAGDRADRKKKRKPKRRK